MMRRILYHLKTEWFKYLLEVVVVILGILIAFNLEQWGEERANRKREIEILKEFKRALAADLAEMRGNILLHECSIGSSKIILKAIKNNLPYHDSLDNYFSFTHAFSTFTGRGGPIEQLKNTNLAIVSNDTLRLQLISMYDEVFPRIGQFEIAIKRDYEQLRDFDRLYFEAYDVETASTNTRIPPAPWGIMHPLDFTALKTNPQYAALLRARISNQTGLLRIHYKPAEKKLSKLLTNIDLEIARLE